MGLLNINENNLHYYNGNNITVSLNYMNNVKMFYLNTGKHIDDCPSYINSFVNKLNKFEFDSILIGGAGLGILAHWVDTNTSCSKIDVIENESEVITWLSESNHLSSDINIIEGDAFNHNITASYDLILMDLWWDTAGDYNNDELKLITKYSGSLNESGSLYFPINSKVLNLESI
jgi:hypothetical protein|tara:strand:+ start:807 stop:1331 length:525 start_codon:yes stop_codon:yes gene_type:complete